MDIYTTLAAAAGEPAKKALKEHKQPIDGVNNLIIGLAKLTKAPVISFSTITNQV